MPKKLIYGVGVNDCSEPVTKTINGKLVICKIYDTWRSMLRRCYSSKSKEYRPTYIGCTVCEEWLTFSNFKEWMIRQDWQGKHLDKDIILEGNRQYCPDFCVFVDPMINTFYLDKGISSAGGLVGCYKSKGCSSFVATCQNPLSKKRESIGSYRSKESAHLAWKKRKHELACQLAELQPDQRVADALRSRYV